ncbi:endonuclease/exonuclease/phosphatase family protein [Streptomyces sp. NPDC059455]|uniref:endonuclease/exonuclease/phosphatase family protein n=1 Tax=Streptomyces sp. NPDC059455 TaxID=3346837 RepID=UPI00369108DE
MPVTKSADDSGNDTFLIASCNFEGNGVGDPGRRRAMHATITDIGPGILLRQECDKALANNRKLLYEDEDALGLRGWIGPKKRKIKQLTGIFVDQSRFRCVGEWRDKAVWNQPPTTLSLKIDDCAVPFIASSVHASYSSPARRRLEAERWTMLNDKAATVPGASRAYDRDRRKTPVYMIGGGDWNSYPEPGLDHVQLPDWSEIDDEPHIAHRSVLDAHGRRIADSYPDRILRTAGLEDIARHAVHTNGAARRQALAPTCGVDWQGGRQRVDRIYASKPLLPAITDVKVIDVDWSDHDVLVATVNTQEFIQILNHTWQLALAA